MHTLFSASPRSRTRPHLDVHSSNVSSVSAVNDAQGANSAFPSMRKSIPLALGCYFISHDGCRKRRSSEYAAARQIHFAFFWVAHSVVNDIVQGGTITDNLAETGNNTRTNNGVVQ